MSALLDSPSVVCPSPSLIPAHSPSRKEALGLWAASPHSFLPQPLATTHLRSVSAFTHSGRFISSHSDTMWFFDNGHFFIVTFAL